MFIYMPNAATCYYSGPLSDSDMAEEQSRCTNLALGRLGQLRPGGNDYSNTEWEDLDIRVYGSDASDFISHSNDPGSEFAANSWIIDAGLGDDQVGLTASYGDGYYDNADSVDLGPGDDIALSLTGQY